MLGKLAEASIAVVGCDCGVGGRDSLVAEGHRLHGRQDCLVAVLDYLIVRSCRQQQRGSMRLFCSKNGLLVPCFHEDTIVDVVGIPACHGRHP